MHYQVFINILDLDEVYVCTLAERLSQGLRCIRYLIHGHTAG